MAIFQQNLPASLRFGPLPRPKIAASRRPTAVPIWSPFLRANP